MASPAMRCTTVSVLLIVTIAIVVFLVVQELLLKIIEWNFPIEDKSSLPRFDPWGLNGQGINVNLKDSQLQFLLDNGTWELHDKVDNVLEFNRLSEEDKTELEVQFIEYGFNKFISDRIPLSRSLYDLRPPECRTNVPRAPGNITLSVIIVFYNEAWSTLMRTVFSVLNRTPGYLLQELILIDDASTEQRYAYPILENYLSIYKKVKIIRHPSRHGFKNESVQAVANAVGEVIAFLQSKCEVYHGWAEPLVWGIYYNNGNSLVVPVIDEIDPVTFEYKYRSDVMKTANITASSHFTNFTTTNYQPKHKTSKEMIALLWTKDRILAGDRTFLHRLLLNEMAVPNACTGYTISSWMPTLECVLQMNRMAKLDQVTIETIPCSHVGVVKKITFNPFLRNYQ